MDALRDNAFVLRLALSDCSGANLIHRVFDTALDAVGGYDSLTPYKKIKSINLLLGWYEKISVCMGLLGRPERTSVCMGFLGRSEKISLCMNLLGRSRKF